MNSPDHSIRRYWSTSTDLDDKTDYPFFMRTIPDDGKIAIGAADFMVQNDMKTVAVIYVNDAYGGAYASAFTTAARKPVNSTSSAQNTPHSSSHCAQPSSLLLSVHRRRARHQCPAIWVRLQRRAELEDCNVVVGMLLGLVDGDVVQAVW